MKDRRLIALLVAVSTLIHLGLLAATTFLGFERTVLGSLSILLALLATVTMWVMDE